MNTHSFRLAPPHFLRSTPGLALRLTLRSAPGLLLALVLAFPARSQTVSHNKHSGPAPAFRVIPLGVKGGLDESDLSSYMLAAAGTNDYICLDAGTLRFGILRAIRSGLFDASATADVILRRYIRAYLISHPHLDHVAGLIINSPDDSTKNIYGLPFCLDVLRDNYFTWKSWANFADQGDTPALHKYHYAPLTPNQETPIANTTLSVRAFPLSHSNPNQSTAFLVRNGEAFLLYLGDTGADSIEHSDKLHLLWQAIAPLIRLRQLKAIFIEVSFPNSQPERLLFGHLTPRLLTREMQDLEGLAAGGLGSLKGLPVVITHIKPSGDNASLHRDNLHGDNASLIKQELRANNPLGLRWIFPEQAKLLEF
jgi:cAMP phosphodiesterase